MRILFLTALSAAAIGLVAACSHDATAPQDSELDRAKQATVKYADLSAALADGYADINVVLPNMGRHYMKQSLVDDKFEIEKPEILVYNTIDGQTKLVAVEYAVPLDKSVNAPTGFSGSDDVWDKNTTFGLWLVHAWVHRSNPAGVFKPMNMTLP